MLEPLKCVYCGSENIVAYEERMIAYERKIGKNRKINKKIIKEYDCGAGAYGIECKKCYATMEIVEDNTGKIIKLEPRS